MPWASCGLPEICGNTSVREDRITPRERCSDWDVISGDGSPSSPKERARRKREVYLNVYDLDAMTASFNDFMLRWNAGLGTFHCGVEVLGEELYFAYGDTDDSGVIISAVPRSHPVHIYRETLSMGESTLSEHGITSAIVQIMNEWPANSYHPITRNCVAFAEVLLLMLEVPDAFPEWVRGAAEVGKSRMLLPVADYTWAWVKWYCQEETDDQEHENDANIDR
eukprot:CAMPEP_0194481866 /NCGR_PEP_ID=MMETSP0253-20130528/4086_1 /TAXON_ID=2966 /ORGANISM="Noctiluca scintillans" /LENGTH=222 /DNA_ID=CAMNT_0039321373 /DNA_START=29 /DNA_END=697 /DNA_ORIENTATION=+